ncbi:GTP-binding protein [Azospirillum lipoferum]|uniref:GTPase Der n=1 Tax=Azospirillum lipoferum TaxID=193 RepID=A0A5A9GW43_AZOLI|nr:MULTISPECIES: ribosome biogenesis GTPase Der [Azospirillum]KAA0598610.1 ribosome biogenesis GTPase Der [Azospirillum lipoferum]MCP1609374.1 GTP-binding protein [Azospirillum lipoferum]MDW5535317.1 ribosome biogenesis GTPase Der [Azospirillum sp. NL1]
MSFTVVLVGRPNVGKSTLFNRLAGKKLALVDDTPGVTRDWRSAPAHVGGLSFTVVDTAGLEDVTDDSLEARMRRQTEQALARADVALFIIDARAGITPLDRHFANLLRRGKTPVLLVANKTEGKASQPGLFESYELGLGDPIPLSAEHGEGMADLVEALLPYAPAEGDGEVEDKDDGYDPSIPIGDQPEPEEDRSKPIQIAIVGRPNVGKSTLLNSLLGEERVLTGPEAGMTRDAIAVDWEWRDRRFKLVDTAGMRRRARVDEKVEKLAVADSLRVIRMANVVVLVVDAAAILDKQDLTIARLVISEGRALVIAVNKWDTVDDRAMALRQVEDKLQAALGYIKGVTVVTISALKGHKLDTLLDGVLETYTVWNRRIPTAQLNRWIEGVLEHHPPPLVEGRRVKIRYVTQVKTRPPTFALFVNKPLDLPESYQRYLTTHLRESFDMPGVPVRLLLRKGKNPYAED